MQLESYDSEVYVIINKGQNGIEKCLGHVLDDDKLTPIPLIWTTKSEADTYLDNYTAAVPAFAGHLEVRKAIIKVQASKQ
jgi:hypothetical protein